jgi:hypothetical protein
MSDKAVPTDPSFHPIPTKYMPWKMLRPSPSSPKLKETKRKATLGDMYRKIDSLLVGFDIVLCFQPREIYLRWTNLIEKMKQAAKSDFHSILPFKTTIRKMNVVIFL